MNQALQNTIAFHVDEGYALEALTDEERATLVRGSETLHLRLDGSTVYLARTTAPAPASIATIVPPRRRRGRLLAVLALSGAVIVAVAIAAVSLNSDGAPASPRDGYTCRRDRRGHDAERDRDKPRHINPRQRKLKQ